MNNIQKAAMWGMRALMWTIKWSIGGVVVGAVVGLLAAGGALSGVSSQDQGNIVLLFATCGACLAGGAAGIVPALLAMWFLFLHMIGQVSSSIKNG